MQKKPLKKVSTHFKKLGIEGKYLNMVKAIYDKPTANIIFKGEKTESIPPKIRSKTRVTSFPTIIQLSSGSPNYYNQRSKRSRKIQIRKEEVKLSLVCR